jgi:Rps23 Pro-64 3,4-dihydroxylase Tpa1-like proline 4-hydroxylase
MTPKQILDSFSETLVKDERILSAQERALITTLLQHAKAATGSNPEMQEAVRRVIASAIGETVAQRAFAVLGGSVVERILESSSLPEVAVSRTAEVLGPSGPQTPGTPRPIPPGPQTPGTPIRRDAPMHPAPGPQTPGTPLRDTPIPPGPQTPGHGFTKTVVSQAAAAVAERPQNMPARSVVLDEFLAPQELAELTRFTLEHENDFLASEVLSPNAENGVVNYDHRRSRVLTELGHHQDLMLERIKAVLPSVLEKLGMNEFNIRAVEAQITASNDGDFFHFHSDNGADHVASRHLTFVYFFHREPRQFEGGELRIHDASLEEGQYVSQGSYQTVIPQQNQIVFFPCELMHEVTPVKSPTGLFADSRFTLNGWLRQ